MRVILSLLFLICAGVALIVLPESFFGIPQRELRGALRLWEGSLKLFAVPLCLLFLRVTKNVFIRFATVLWGVWMLLITSVFFLRVDEHAPALNGHGKIFLASVLLVSLTVFLFSALEFTPKRFKLGSIEDPPVNPS